MEHALKAARATLAPQGWGVRAGLCAEDNTYCITLDRASSCNLERTG